ncbi:glycogen phosphorylase [Serratia fonticola]|nr:glycogen phosphorylase [Serratia fonticola]
MDSFFNTKRCQEEARPKRLYYLSIKILLGQSLRNNLMNLGLLTCAKQAVSELDFEDIINQEPDAALGKISLMIYEQLGNLKYKYRKREFWCRRYYVDIVGNNTSKIQKYIKHQQPQNKLREQLTTLYQGGQFTGRK